MSVAPPKCAQSATVTPLLFHLAPRSHNSVRLWSSRRERKHAHTYSYKSFIQRDNHAVKERTLTQRTPLSHTFECSGGETEADVSREREWLFAAQRAENKKGNDIAYVQNVDNDTERGLRRAARRRLSSSRDAAHLSFSRSMNVPLSNHITWKRRVVNYNGSS